MSSTVGVSKDLKKHSLIIGYCTSIIFMLICMRMLDVCCEFSCKIRLAKHIHTHTHQNPNVPERNKTIYRGASFLMSDYSYE